LSGSSSKGALRWKINTPGGVREGNEEAQRMIANVFDVCDRSWRGIGIIPKSGYRLRYEFREHDADRIFQVADIRTAEPAICISGQVLKGIKKRTNAPPLARSAHRQTPLGATMVSAEGACAAYYNYGRHLISLGASPARGKACPRRL